MNSMCGRLGRRDDSILFAGLTWVALRIAFTESVAAGHGRRARGLKLFLMLPRMLSRKARGGLVSKEKLRKKVRIVQWWPLGGIDP